ncbi:MAG: arylsulfatase [Roseibacillus sp.]|nr:arylsulfatase [Roseibacillus sp.]
MRKTICRSGLVALAGTCLVMTAFLSAAGKPNVVFILADDLGYGDLKAYNPKSKIPTPYLDALAAEGIVFTDAHSGGSTCVPSRYSLITGQFAARRDRLNYKAGPLIARGQLTFARVLQEQGYRTAMVGKWHQGFTMKAAGVFDYGRPLAGGPVDCGFDSFFGMHASLDIPPYFYIKDRTPIKLPTETVVASASVGGKEDWNKIQGAFWRAGDVAPDFKHTEVTPRFAAEAVKVIESHEVEKPLFLYLALPSPHTPWLPTVEFIGKSGAGMYGDFVMQVDSVVGKVMRALKKAGMSENSLVIFSSDNGPVWYDKDTDRFGHRSCGPLRGIKGSAWEGGHRMPFIARWPGRVPAGKTTSHAVAFSDILATFADVSGKRKIPQGAAEDSVSFLPVLLHPGRKHKPRPPILHGSKVIRDGDWKLIDTKGGRGFGVDRKVKYGVELYNLQEDLSEKNNLAAKMPGKVESLRAKMRRILGN